MEKRVKRIYSHLKKHLDLIVLQNATDPHIDRSFFYVTGLTSGIFEYSSVFLYPDGSVEILTTPLEEESAKKSRLRLHIFKTKEERKKLLSRFLKGRKRIGINASELTQKNFEEMKKASPKSEFQDVSQAIMKSRLVKDSEELDRIGKACQIVSEAVEEIPTFIDVGAKEKEIAAELNYLMQRKGATAPAFETIVASGPNSSEPHYSSGDRKIKKGDFVLVDVGALYKKYASDLTRTFVIGKATRKQKEIYDIVLKAQRKAISKIKEGAKGKAIHREAAMVIEATKYGGKFIHGLGHSLGLAPHDGSALNPSVNVTLRRGMVFTVEPGIYLSGYGGVRIEDDILVTRSGCKILTSASRELMEL